MALLLIAGPLNVQAAFACSAMGQVVHAACCCNENAMLPRSHASAETHTPCCTPSAELTYETAVAVLPTASSGPTHQELPPAILPIVSKWPIEPVRAAVVPPSPATSPDHPAHSRLYLTTLRLRI
jgi:hypothetical protein